MNKLELFLESIVTDCEINLTDRQLRLKTKDLVLLFQRTQNSTKCWMDCFWVEHNGNVNDTSHLRFDFPVRTIQKFLMKYTNTTLDNRHHIIHEKSIPNNKDCVIIPVYEAFVKEINDNQYPIYKLSILKNKIERNTPEKSLNNSLRKTKI